jgi:hypothetical protein
LGRECSCRGREFSDEIAKRPTGDAHVNNQSGTLEKIDIFRSLGRFSIHHDLFSLPQERNRTLWKNRATNVDIGFGEHEL